MSQTLSQIDHLEHLESVFVLVICLQDQEGEKNLDALGQLIILDLQDQRHSCAGTEAHFVQCLQRTDALLSHCLDLLVRISSNVEVFVSAEYCKSVEHPTEPQLARCVAALLIGGLRGICKSESPSGDRKQLTSRR